MNIFWVILRKLVNCLAVKQHYFILEPPVNIYMKINTKFYIHILNFSFSEDTRDVWITKIILLVDFSTKISKTEHFHGIINERRAYVTLFGSYGNKLCWIPVGAF